MRPEVSPDQAAHALAEVRYRQQQIRASGPNLRLAFLGWALLVFVGLALLDFVPRPLAQALMWGLALLGGGLSAWYGARRRQQVRRRHNNPWPVLALAGWTIWHVLVVVTASLLHAHGAFPYVFTTAAVLDALPLALLGLALGGRRRA